MNQWMNIWRTNNRRNHRMNMQANKWTKLIKKTKKTEWASKRKYKQKTLKRKNEEIMERKTDWTNGTKNVQENKWMNRKKKNEWSHGTMGKKEKAKKSIDWKSTNEWKKEESSSDWKKEKCKRINKWMERINEKWNKRKVRVREKRK